MLVKFNMIDEKIVCEQCGSAIVPYYDEKYNGRRAKCRTCGVEFPLD